MNHKIRYYFTIIAISLLISCNNDGRYEQRYSNYTQYNKMNERNKGWFPDSLLKNDALNIKNDSFLKNGCVFGVFTYQDNKLYDSIFSNKAYLDSAAYESFISQLEITKNSIPKWFLDVDYWKSEQRELILIDEYYIYRDRQNKKIYYFHPQKRFNII